MPLIGVLLLAGCFLAPFALAWAIGKQTRLTPQVRLGAWIAAALTTGHVVLFTRGVFSNTSSTAGLAFLVLPLIEVLVFGATLAGGWAVATLASRTTQRPSAAQLVAVPIAIATGAACWSILHFASLDRRAGNPAESGDALRALHREYLAGGRLYPIWAALLARDGNTLPLARLAANPAAPDDLLLVLAHSDNRSVAWRAVANPQLGEASLRALAQDDRAGDWNLVSNPNLPPDLLRAAAAAATPNQALALALHPRLPIELQESLLTRAVRDGDRYARNSAAVQPALPPALLRELAQDEWELVRRGVAANWHTPIDVLDALAADRDASVRSMAVHMQGERAAERR